MSQREYLEQEEGPKEKNGENYTLRYVTRAFYNILLGLSR